MKKILICFLFFLFIGTSPIYAQLDDIALPTVSITPSLSPSPTTINYQLPYPGILPGSPLYFIKAIRDKTIEIFINEPLKKSSFYLLQADKRLAASITLFDEGNDNTAEMTLSKGQNYLEKSLDQIVVAKSTQKDIGETIARIKLSAGKQLEVISSLQEKAKGETAQKLAGDNERAKELLNRANQIKP